MDAAEREKSIANMMAAAQSVFGPGVRVEKTERGIRFPDGMGFGARDFNARPGADLIARYTSNPSEADTFLAKARSETHPGNFTRSVAANVMKQRAIAMMRKKEYKMAGDTYVEAAQMLVNPKVPVQNARSPAYMELDTVWAAVDVMECFVGASRAFVKAKDYAQADLWVCEAMEVMRNVRYKVLADSTVGFEWMDAHIGTKQYYLQVYNNFVGLAEYYASVGNTGSQLFYTWQALTTMNSLPNQFRPANYSDLDSESKSRHNAVMSYRHPEPSLSAKLEVVDPRVHVHGAWRRIELKKPGGMSQRMGSGVFAYKGYLYVVGGEKFIDGPYYRELWRINLSTFEEWEALPSCPIPSHEVDVLHFYRFVLDINTDSSEPTARAYYFVGSLNLAYFDLQTQRWGYVRTTYKPDDALRTWPFRDDTLQCAAVEVVNGKLYAFGGEHALTSLGCDLLMELDLRTKVWRRLSGSLVPRDASTKLPGPRINASSWVRTKEPNKVYIMYGDANRQAAQLGGEEHGSMNAYRYDDLWSWDIVNEKWKKEKLVGNIPCPRTEMAAVYNPILDKVILFGGYCPTCPTIFPKDKYSFAYSYYADTFICDFHSSPSPSSSETPAANPTVKIPTTDQPHQTPYHSKYPFSFRQVLTRGFPTYRAQAHLVVDTDPTSPTSTPGRTYLFSGYVNTEFVPTRRKDFSRSFSDLWQLKIDIPGGDFAEVDLEEERRTARAGPWQRCFGCGSAGSWRRCGGSCGGRVFFCGPVCLREGWKEHKETHKCRKV